MKTITNLNAQSFRMIRLRSGLLSSTICTLSLGAFTLIEGPQIESAYLRFALAGTCSTVLVEFLTHAIDTVNMQSKVNNSSSSVISKGFIKLQGFSQLFTGV
jgi:hypothetical protein